jgi:hypothetical protein
LAAAFAISSAEATNTKKTPPKPQNVIAPDAALDRLMKGNDRYVQGVSRRHDSPGILPVQFGNDDASSAFVELLTRGDVARGY